MLWIKKKNDRSRILDWKYKWCKKIISESSIYRKKIYIYITKKKSNRLFWLKLQDHRDLHTLASMYKVVRGQSAGYFKTNLRVWFQIEPENFIELRLIENHSKALCF